jgi:hypothetical protein
MRLEMELGSFLEFYRLVTLGKLIQGLVHNLNGPLQNLGMDMEMMEHTLENDQRFPKELSESLLARLQRMESEFDQVGRIIRSAAMRIDMEGDFLRYGNLKSLLEEEISFLQANLYFKHNVRKEIQLSEDLLHVDSVSHEIVRALCWLIQAVVEEMEKGTAKLFGLSGRRAPSALEISLFFEGETLGLLSMEEIEGGSTSPEVLRVQDGSGPVLPLSLLRLHSVSVGCRREPKRIEFTLTIPYPASA